MAWTVFTSGRLSFYAWIAVSILPLVVISFARLALWIRSGCNIKKFESTYLGHGECGSRVWHNGVTMNGGVWHNGVIMNGEWVSAGERESALFYCDSGLCCYMCDCVLIICILYARAESDCPITRCCCKDSTFCGYQERKVTPIGEVTKDSTAGPPVMAQKHSGKQGGKLISHTSYIKVEPFVQHKDDPVHAMNEWMM